VREKDARVTGPLLRQKAEDIVTKMDKNDFVATKVGFTGQNAKTFRLLIHMENKELLTTHLHDRLLSLNILRIV